LWWKLWAVLQKEVGATSICKLWCKEDAKMEISVFMARRLSQCLYFAHQAHISLVWLHSILSETWWLWLRISLLLWHCHIHTDNSHLMPPAST
jgi:hypothetical protein